MKIRIQHDGAPSHFDQENNEEWLEYLEIMGLSDKIVMVTQSANSPDFNLCDLGYFRSLDARYGECAPKTNDDIIACVTQAYWNYPANLINRLWLTHMSCMNEVLKCHGDNTYKIPHMNKDKLERENKLPVVLEVAPIARKLLYPMADDESVEAVAV